MAKSEKQSLTWPRLRGGISRAILYGILIFGAIIMVTPFLWMLSTSVMTIGEANSGRLLPRKARASCPYVNLAKYSEGTLSAFAVSPEVAPESDTGSGAIPIFSLISS